MNPAGGNFTTQLTALNINSHRKCLIDLKSEDLYKYSHTFVFSSKNRFLLCVQCV